MGLFDDYVPDPQLICPICKRKLSGWQAKDGPRAMVQWRQRVRWPQETVPDQGRDESIHALAQHFAAERVCHLHGVP
jgi:hypothetical protein